MRGKQEIVRTHQKDVAKQVHSRSTNEVNDRKAVLRETFDNFDQKDRVQTFLNKIPDTEEEIERKKEKVRKKAAKQAEMEEERIAEMHLEEIEQKQANITSNLSHSARKNIMTAQAQMVKSQWGKDQVNIHISDTDIATWKLYIDVTAILGVESTLSKDFMALEDANKKQKMPGTEKVSLMMEIRFPDDQNFSPPFVRVLWPRFAFRTAHVTIGGSLCTETLTKSGWSPANSVEGVLIDLVVNMDMGGGRIEMKDIKHDQPLKEAKEAFERVAKDHNWEI